VKKQFLSILLIFYQKSNNKGVLLMYIKKNILHEYISY